MEIEVDESLRAQVFHDLSLMARLHPRSLAADIKGPLFNTVVDFVSEHIDLGIADREIGMILALQKCKAAMPEAFVRHRTRAEALPHFWKT